MKTISKLFPPTHYLTRQFSLHPVSRATCWPKPDYGPQDVYRSAFLNGLKVAAARTLGDCMAACTVMFQAGTRCEYDDSLGALHFLRASTLLTGCAYSGYMKIRYLQQKGAYISSSTDRQSISFTLRCPQHLFPDLKWFLLDTAMRCCYAQHELEEKVKPLLRDELTRIPPMHRLMDLAAKACFAGPLSQSVYACPGRINDMTQQTLTNFTECHFIPRNCSVASIGVPFEETLQLAEHLSFGVPNKVTCQMPSFPRGGFELHDYGAGSDTWIAVVVPGCGTCDLFYLIKHAIVAAACGVGAIHRGTHRWDRALHTPLAALAGCDACTDYKAFNVSYADQGMFGITARTRSESANCVARLMVEFMTHLGSLTCQQIEEGKRRLKLNLLLNDEDSIKVSEGLAVQVTYGHQVDSAEDLCAMIDGISPNDVSCVAATLAGKSCQMAMAAVGDAGVIPHFTEVLCP